MVHFFLPEFRALLHDLGAPLDLPTEAVGDDLQLHITEVDTASNFAANGVVVLVPLTPAGATTRAEFRTTRFHEGHYLQANPGLADAAVDPTVHFSIHGFREGRPLRSPDTRRRWRGSQPTSPAMGLVRDVWNRVGRCAAAFRWLATDSCPKTTP